MKYVQSKIGLLEPPTYLHYDVKILQYLVYSVQIQLTPYPPYLALHTSWVPHASSLQLYHTKDHSELFVDHNTEKVWC